MPEISLKYFLAYAEVKYFARGIISSFLSLSGGRCRRITLSL
jgi:hypothetical protein